MNQRLVWNFEFVPKTSAFPKQFLIKRKFEDIKWEHRFFWSNELPIILNTLDNSLLDLANYTQKHREDYYYLLPEHSYNIKRRHNKLLYKPLLKKSEMAQGFGAKVDLNEATSDDSKIQKIARYVVQEGVEVYVKKEAFIYKFPTTPTIKLELARLEVHNNIYFSTCIEGKSQELVESIAEHLLGKHISCEYVTFLKNNLHL
jgi:hypothetical protein